MEGHKNVLKLQGQLLQRHSGLARSNSHFAKARLSRAEPCEHWRSFVGESHFCGLQLQQLSARFADGIGLLTQRTQKAIVARRSRLLCLYRSKRSLGLARLMNKRVKFRSIKAAQFDFLRKCARKALSSLGCNRGLFNVFLKRRGNNRFTLGELLRHSGHAVANSVDALCGAFPRLLHGCRHAGCIVLDLLKRALGTVLGNNVNFRFAAIAFCHFEPRKKKWPDQNWPSH
ncbi:hypothetical protein [Comamonas odontotermitis]|uniref:hypothetical protein n=1 Tax=Comamonas odontotermitis TaxID=379895 RepID=UPI001CC7B1CD|nr:hypothetical protein [Comamonas odontotermitis]UBB19173.1 hypothetical protein LAD35_15055 [Comamonas odontotermitis]